jgi:hypothetical protein
MTNHIHQEIHHVHHDCSERTALIAEFEKEANVLADEFGTDVEALDIHDDRFIGLAYRTGQLLEDIQEELGKPEPECGVHPSVADPTTGQEFVASHYAGSVALILFITGRELFTDYVDAVDEVVTRREWLADVQTQNYKFGDIAYTGVCEMRRALAAAA